MEALSQYGGVRLNYDHLHQRILSINGAHMNREEFLAFLRERIVNTDIEAVKREISLVVRDRSSLDIWSTDYFWALVGKITFRATYSDIYWR